MIIFYLILMLMGVQGESSPRIHVVSGVFIKPVPDDIFIFEETTPLFFEVKFNFTKPQNYFIETLNEHCPTLEFGRGPVSPICMIDQYLLNNFNYLTGKIDFMYQTLTTLTPPKVKIKKISTLIENNKRPPLAKPIVFLPEPSSEEIEEYITSTTTTTTTTSTTSTPAPIQSLVQGNPPDVRTRQQLTRDRFLQENHPANVRHSPPILVPPSTTDLPPMPTVRSFRTEAEKFLHRNAHNLTRVGRSVMWNNLSNQTNSRTKRQASILALAAGWVGAKNFNYIDPPTTSTNIQLLYDHLQANVDINSTNSIRIAHTVEIANNRLNDNIMNLTTHLGHRIRLNNHRITDIQRTMQDGALRSYLFDTRLAEDLYRYIELVQYSQIQSACMSGRLPLQAIDSSSLKMELVHLNKTLATVNMTTVISNSQLSKYYHHEMTRCSFDPEHGTIDIKLDVPIKSLDQIVTVAEVFSLPFYHHANQETPQLCYMSHSHDFVILINNIPYPISNADSSLCDLSKGSCQYSSLSTRASNHAGCIKALLSQKGLSYEILHQTCPFTCRETQSKEVLVTKLGWHDSYYRYAVTQPPTSSKIICKQNDTFHTFSIIDTTAHSFGVYIIELTCGCYIYLNNQHPIVRPPFPCLIGKSDSGDFLSPKINIAIPSRWSLINTAELTKANHYHETLFVTEGYENFSDIYNANWFKHDLVFNLTIPEIKPFGSFQTYVDSFHHIVNPIISIFWLVLLTILVIYVFYKTWTLSQQLLVFAMLIPGACADSLTIYNNLFMGIISLSLLSILVVILLLVCCGLRWKYNKTTHRVMNLRDVETRLHSYHVSTEPKSTRLDPTPLEPDIYAGYITTTG